MAKGYSQQQGLDYNETFAPVVKQQSLRLLLAIAVREKMQIHHIDVSTAFLYGEIKEDLYVQIPDGYNIQNKEDKVLKLNKALYGLKQAPRSWNKKLVQTFQDFGLEQLQTDNCIFYKDNLLISVYVDDMLIISRFENEINNFKTNLQMKFKSKDLGQLKFILGIKVHYTKNGSIILNQKQYIDKIIKKFNLEHSKSTSIPIQQNHNLTNKFESENETLRELIDPNIYRQVIGSLIYLMTSTRPDISYSIGLLSRFMTAPIELNWRFLKRVLRYLKSTINYSLVYEKFDEKHVNLIGYSDSDYASNLEDRRSTSGYLFKYGNCLILWNSSKQKIVALSSTESEYIALTNAAKEAIWIKQMLIELKRFSKTPIFYCDNKSSISLTKNPEFHSRSKHIDIRHHFIREKIQNNELYK